MPSVFLPTAVSAGPLPVTRLLPPSATAPPTGQQMPGMGFVPRAPTATGQENRASAAMPAPAAPPVISTSQEGQIIAASMNGSLGTSSGISGEEASPWPGAAEGRALEKPSPADNAKAELEQVAQRETRLAQVAASGETGKQDDARPAVGMGDAPTIAAGKAEAREARKDQVADQELAKLEAARPVPTLEKAAELERLTLAKENAAPSKADQVENDPFKDALRPAILDGPKAGFDPLAALAEVPPVPGADALVRADPLPDRPEPRPIVTAEAPPSAATQSGRTDLAVAGYHGAAETTSAADPARLLTTA